MSWCVDVYDVCVLCYVCIICLCICRQSLSLSHAHAHPHAHMHTHIRPCAHTHTPIHNTKQAEWVGKIHHDTPEIEMSKSLTTIPDRGLPTGGWWTPEADRDLLLGTVLCVVL